MGDKETISVSDTVYIKDSVRIIEVEPEPMLNIRIKIRDGKIDDIDKHCDDNYSSIYVYVEIFDFIIVKDYLQFDMMMDKIVHHVFPWIKTINNVLCLDADLFKIAYPEAEHFDWLYGYIEINCNRGSYPKEKKFDFAFKMTGEKMKYQTKLCIPPTEIRNSILQFKRDNPLDYKTAFIITKFSKQHDPIIEFIKIKCREVGICAYIATDNYYHKNLFENVLTYIWCSNLIFVIYDELEQESVSSNVNIEFGYALALQKDIIFLKEKKVQKRPTDIQGIIYEEFEYDNLEATINNVFDKRKTFLEKSILPPAGTDIS